MTTKPTLKPAKWIQDFADNSGLAEPYSSISGIVAYLDEQHAAGQGEPKAEPARDCSIYSRKKAGGVQHNYALFSGPHTWAEAEEKVDMLSNNRPLWEFKSVRHAAVKPGHCYYCEKGFPLKNGMHYPTQALGMIPDTPCELAPVAEPQPVSIRAFKSPNLKCECFIAGQGSCGRSPAGDFMLEGWPDSIVLCERCEAHEHSHVAEPPSPVLENRLENETDLGFCNQPRILQPAPALESSQPPSPVAGELPWEQACDPAVMSQVRALKAMTTERDTLKSQLTIANQLAVSLTTDLVHLRYGEECETEAGKAAAVAIGGKLASVEAQLRSHQCEMAHALGLEHATDTVCEPADWPTLEDGARSLVKTYHSLVDEFMARGSALAEANARAERLEAALLSVQDLSFARLTGQSVTAPPAIWQHDMREIERISRAARKAAATPSQPLQGAQPVEGVAAGGEIVVGSRVHRKRRNGTVTRIEAKQPHGIIVRWDGGLSSRYAAEELDLMPPATSEPVTGERCATCGKPAACYGSYEGSEPAYACDDCCGHGCEDGKCEPVSETKWEA